MNKISLMLFLYYVATPAVVFGMSTESAPKEPFEQAIKYLEQNREQFPNQNVLTVIDMTIPASNERMFVMNLQTGEIKSYLVAHGKGSDPQMTGIPVRFSNVDGSHMTSLGFYRVGEQIYSPKHGPSLALDGLSVDNSLARKREIIIHGADYMGPGSVRGWGRSWGCPAVPPKDVPEIIEQLKDGSLLYIWAGQHTSS